tara:strand:- start:95 stop:811 length:717 start_codon:yes stop_codon:yes gene_type:complete
MTTTTLPNLAGVIKTTDIYKKMKFDYVAWAKTAQILREHAPGWQFCLKENRPNTDLFSYIFNAPDETGFIMGYFENIDTGVRTSVFPFAITDNANRPIALDKISSNHFQNSHRRCLCACACFTFGLAYELWAQIEIDEAKQAPPPKTGVAKTPTKPNQKLEPTSVLKKLPDPITKDAKVVILEKLQTLHTLHPEKMKELIEAFREKFGIKDLKITRHITTAEQGEFLALEISKIDEGL